MIKRLVVMLSMLSMVLLLPATTLAGGCYPYREYMSGEWQWGSRWDYASNVDADGIRGYVENDGEGSLGFPYVADGTGYSTEVARFEMNGHHGGNDHANAFIALEVGAGQGRATSSRVHIYVETEDGYGVLVNDYHYLRDVPGSDTMVHLALTTEPWGPIAGGEVLHAYINGYEYLGSSTVYLNGPNEFDHARATTIIHNAANQVPGISADYNNITGIQTSRTGQGGWGNAGANGETSGAGIHYNSWGVRSTAIGAVATRDANC